MTGTTIGVILVVTAMAVESVAQVLLKIGAAGGPGILSPSLARFAARIGPGAAPAGWIALGVTAYVGEIFLYTLALHRLDVSIAFPLGSLCFVGVALISRALLGETVGMVRWLGIGCILAGAVLLAA